MFSLPIKTITMLDVRDLSMTDLRTIIEVKTVPTSKAVRIEEESKINNAINDDDIKWLL